MKRELDKALCKDFPEIFADRHADKTVTAMCWGFECNDGWEPLIRKLCEHLMMTKEICGGVPKAFQVKEKFGELRFYVDEAHDIQWAIINDAESKSTSVCEICGESGTTRSKGYWVKTVCAEHAKEHGYWLFSHEANRMGLKPGEYLDYTDFKKERK